MKKPIQHSVVLLLLLVLMACNSNSSISDIQFFHLDVPAQRINFPVADINVFWIDNSSYLITTGSPGTTYKEGELVSYYLVTNNTVELQYLPLNNKCQRFRYSINGILPDGRIGLIEECFPDEDPHDDGLVRLLAYDVYSKDYTQIVEQALPPVGVARFSWNSEMSMGVQEFGSLMGSLIWLTPEESMPLEVVLKEGSLQWNLADNYGRTLARDNRMEDLGIASNPAWSPINEQIAFMASLEAIGKNGIQRAESEFRLYLMDADSRAPVVFLNEIFFPHQLSWSPNGQWLAFVGAWKNNCPHRGCLWLYSPQQEKLILLTTDVIRNFSWSPSSEQILASRECSENCGFVDEETNLNTGAIFQVAPCGQAGYASCKEAVIYDISHVLQSNSIE